MKNRTGFTMIEMLTVMIIMTVMAGIFLPTFFNFTKHSRLRAAARNVTSALRNARSYAITQRMDYACTIYLTENAVSIYETPDAVKKLYMSETIDFKDGNGVETGDITISFTPRGTAGSGGSMQVYSGIHFLEIRINGTTGRVKIGDLDVDIP